MDLTELRALIDEGESETLEFKRSTGELRPGMETICAFLNGQGGRVLFGVSNSGRIQGAVGDFLVGGSYRGSKFEGSRGKSREARRHTREVARNHVRIG